MSDPLTLARLSPLSRLVPARGEARLVADGPVVNADGTRGVVYAVFGGGVSVAIDDSSGGRLGTWLWEDVRVDTGEDAVRDRLVRLGLLPHTLRDHPGAAVAAGMGVGVLMVRRGGWRRKEARGSRPGYWRRPGIAAHGFMVDDATGWWFTVGGCSLCGPETGDAGKLAADLAALRLGCVLEEPDGWYIPLPGGAGFVAKEAHDAV